MFADELHAYGHVFREAGGESDGWDTSGIRRNNVNIGEIHFERVVCFLAEFECSGGAGRGEENVTGSKSSFKITKYKKLIWL